MTEACTDVRYLFRLRFASMCHAHRGLVEVVVVVVADDDGVDLRQVFANGKEAHGARNHAPGPGKGHGRALVAKDGVSKDAPP